MMSDSLTQSVTYVGIELLWQLRMVWPVVPNGIACLKLFGLLADLLFLKQFILSPKTKIKKIAFILVTITIRITTKLLHISHDNFDPAVLFTPLTVFSIPGAKVLLYCQQKTIPEII